MEEKVRKTIELYESALEKYVEIGDEAWKEVAQDLLQKRLRWLEKNRNLTGTPVEKAFKAICLKLEIDPKDLQIVEKTKKRIVYRSYNFCPTLEACKVLGLDTRKICRLTTEEPMQKFLEAIDPKLRFTRNYEKIRPYCEYCEETIEEV